MTAESPSTTDRLAEIAARAANTAYFTPPWRYEDEEFGADINFGPHYQIEDAAGDLVAVVEDESIRELVLNARADIEHLLSLVDSLRARLDTAEGVLRELATLQDRIPDTENGDWSLGWDHGLNAAYSDVRRIAALGLDGEGLR